MALYYDRLYNLSEQLVSDLEIDINKHQPIAMEMVTDAPELYWHRINRSTPLMIVFIDQDKMLPTEFNIESDLPGEMPSDLYLEPIQDAWEAAPYWPNVDNLYQYIHELRKAFDNQE